MEWAIAKAEVSMRAFLDKTSAARPAGVVVESTGGSEVRSAACGFKVTPINVALMGLASKPLVILVVAWGAQLKIVGLIMGLVGSRTNPSGSCPLKVIGLLRATAVPATDWS